jgi:hypothetical protein
MVGYFHAIMGGLVNKYWTMDLEDRRIAFKM